MQKHDVNGWWLFHIALVFGKIGKYTALDWKTDIW